MLVVATAPVDYSENKIITTTMASKIILIIKKKEIARPYTFIRLPKFSFVPTPFKYA